MREISFIRSLHCIRLRYKYKSALNIPAVLSLHVWKQKVDSPILMKKKIHPNIEYVHWSIGRIRCLFFARFLHFHMQTDSILFWSLRKVRLIAVIGFGKSKLRTFMWTFYIGFDFFHRNFSGWFSWVSIIFFPDFFLIGFNSNVHKWMLLYSTCAVSMRRVRCSVLMRNQRVLVKWPFQVKMMIIFLLRSYNNVYLRAILVACIPEYPATTVWSY